MNTRRLKALIAAYDALFKAQALLDSTDDIRDIDPTNTIGTAMLRTKDAIKDELA